MAVAYTFPIISLVRQQQSVARRDPTVNPGGCVLKFLLLFVLFSSAATAQNLCTPTGPAGYVGIAGSAITFTCSGAVPPTCIPPQVLDPTTGKCILPPPTTCAANQLSSVLGTRQLQRQCSTAWSYSGSHFAMKPRTDLTNTLAGVLSDATHNGTWPNYVSGYSMTATIQSGFYVALSFVPTTSGSIQFTNDPSFGDGGIISLSTHPGQLLTTDAYKACSYGRGASNSMYVAGNAPQCKVVAGTTYYVNFTDTDYQGNSMCYNGSNNQCVTSSIAYSEIVGK
jgi:hypothetical protein